MVQQTSTVAEEVVRTLSKYGVDRIFGIPGGGPTADIVSTAGKLGMEFVLTQHETSAVIMAGTYGQRKGTVGVVVTAIGPGVSNAANGVAHASLDRLPVLIIADRYSSGVHEVALRQQFDHLTLMKPITKDQITLHEATFHSGLRRAVATALADRQGPVFIDFPGGAAGKAAPPEPNSTFCFPNRTRTTVAAGALQEASARLQSARQPVIIAGIGALELPAGALESLAQKLRAPVLTSPKAKGAIAGDAVWSAGVFMGGKLEQEILSRADLIFLVGYDPVEYLPKPWDLPTFAISLDYVTNTEHAFSANIELSGDIGAALEQISASLKQTSSDWSTEEVAKYCDMVVSALDVPVQGVSPNQIIAITRELAPRDVLMVTDVGANKLLVVELWDAYAPGDFLMSNGLATMGYCIPAALGAKLAQPERPIVCLCGDAGFMMRLPELLTGRRHKLPIVYVIFADDEHSLISAKQVIKGQPKYGLDFPRPNYLALAEGFGMRGYTANSQAEFRAALQSALNEKTASLIEARIDNSCYVKQFDVIREL